MFSLFRAELSRFKTWAFAFAALHLLVLFFYQRMVGLLQLPTEAYQLWAGIYAALALLFALYQLGGYKKPNAWLCLLHRPISPGRIFLALSGASATLFAIAVLLPLLVSLVGIDLLSVQVVDPRHYWLLCAVPGIVLCGYLVGCCIVLLPRWLGLAMVVFPGLFLFNEASSGRVLLLQAVVIAWLLLLVPAAFKPDLSTRSPRALATVATVVPLLVALYWGLLGFGSAAFQIGMILVGNNPLNQRPAAGGYVEANFSDSAHLLETALGSRSDPESQVWREQLPIARTFRIRHELERLPERGDLTGFAEFDDAKHHVRWTFSHASMLFHGVDLVSRQPVGFLGVNGPQREATGGALAEPPLVVEDRYLLTHRRLYQFDAETTKVHLRLELPDGERFARTPVPVGESIAVLSDRHLYLYPARSFERTDELLVPTMQAPVPGDIAALDRVDLAELVDGYLAAFTFGRGSHSAESVGSQVLLRISPGAPAQELSRRSLTPDFPLLFRFKAIWLSPVIDWASRRAVLALSSPNPLAHASERPATPPAVFVLALVLSALSLAFGWFWLSPQPMPLASRVLWLLTAAAIGPPAAVCLVLLHPRLEREALLLPAPA